MFLHNFWGREKVLFRARGFSRIFSKKNCNKNSTPFFHSKEVVKVKLYLLCNVLSEQSETNSLSFVGIPFLQAMKILSKKKLKRKAGIFGEYKFNLFKLVSISPTFLLQLFQTPF